MNKLSFLLLPLVVLCSQVFSQQPAVIDLIGKKYTTDSFIEAQFELHIWWSVREREEVKKGHLLVAPKDRFRIKLGNEMMVSDGRTYWQYNKKGAQVIISSLSKQDLSNFPSRLLSTFYKDYCFKELEKKGDQTVLSWTADDSSSESSYNKIEIWALTKTGELQKLKMTDRNGNIQTFTFQKTVFNAEIPEEAFSFEVPDNTQVLDNR